MSYQFNERHADERGFLDGEIVGPMGQFFCVIQQASPTFLDFLITQLNVPDSLQALRTTLKMMGYTHEELDVVVGNFKATLRIMLQPDKGAPTT